MTGFEDWILRAGAVAVAAMAVGKVTVWAMQKLVLKPLTATIRADIVERTKPIQPTANGGKSLPDAISILERIESRQVDIGDRLARVEGSMSTHLDWHNTQPS